MVHIRTRDRKVREREHPSIYHIYSFLLGKHRSHDIEGKYIWDVCYHAYSETWKAQHVQYSVCPRIESRDFGLTRAVSTQ